ncbi:MAG: MlaD family protein [Syntrophobacteraceae bacterium]
MSKQANTKVIGGFVVGAIVLVIAGIVLFGSGKLLTKQKKFVLFFEDSVSGLSIGAPVDFRGVKVGTVTDVSVVLEKGDLSLRIPVFIELEPERIKFEASESELMKMVEKKGTKNLIELLAKQGLRAQLVMQSFVTGQLGIHLDFFPDKPLRLVGAEAGYTEIPTIGSSLSELAKTVQNLPLGDIANQLIKTLSSIEKLVDSPEIRETVVSLNQTVKAAHSLLSNVDGQVKPLASSTDLTLVEIRKTFGLAGKLIVDLDSRVPHLLASLEDSSKAAGTTLRGAHKTLDGLAGDNSPVRLELMKTLTEFSAAARSFRVLAQYIETHPEALVRGKGK